MEKVSFPALKISQPIGDFYVGVMNAQDVVAISRADVREMEDELGNYMGIQRRLSQSRVRELQSYVRTYDATFPTSVILAVDEENAEFDIAAGMMHLSPANGKELGDLVRIIDGQHRIEGLKALKALVDEVFQINVALFVGSDISTQANIFATVNLAQTKVNRSLVYDLFDYEKTKSPQKSCHNIAVALDQIDSSPFYHRIKRLGTATAGRKGETLTQAAVVEALLTFISDDPMADRDSILKRIVSRRPSADELQKRPFRALFQQDKEAEITKILLRYFEAVRDKWPNSWNNIERQGNVLPRTNGFRALMRYLKNVYLNIAEDSIGIVPTKDQFSLYFADVKLRDEDFNIQTFPPGTSGEAELYKHLTGRT